MSLSNSGIQGLQVQKGMETQHSSIPTCLATARISVPSGAAKGDRVEGSTTPIPIAPSVTLPSIGMRGIAGDPSDRKGDMCEGVRGGV
jgi:hypothetical protein